MLLRTCAALRAVRHSCSGRSSVLSMRRATAAGACVPSCCCSCGDSRCWCCGGSCWAGCDCAGCVRSTWVYSAGVGEAAKKVEVVVRKPAGGQGQTRRGQPHCRLQRDSQPMCRDRGWVWPKQARVCFNKKAGSKV